MGADGVGGDLGNRVVGLLEQLAAVAGGDQVFQLRPVHAGFLQQHAQRFLGVLVEEAAGVGDVDADDLAGFVDQRGLDGGGADVDTCEVVHARAFLFLVLMDSRKASTRVDSWPMSSGL